MSIEARIRELGSRHKGLEASIREAMMHPSSDTLKVAELKRQKLRLKEEMNRLGQKAVELA